MEKLLLKKIADRAKKETAYTINTRNRTIYIETAL